MLDNTTTYIEFNNAYLSALENGELSALQDELKKLIDLYPRLYNANLFYARCQVGLNNINKAIISYGS